MEQMKITHGSTTLRTITEGDIEQIRQWRNSETVNHYLRSRNFIDAAAQLAWFRSLNPASSIYFMMQENAAPCGVIYAHDIDVAKRSFEGNIFTGDTNYLGTHLPVKASLMLSVFFFRHLNFQEMFSTVHRENKAAAELDRRMGFKLLSREGDFTFSRCAKGDFEKQAAPLLRALLRNAPLEITLEKGDEQYPFLAPIVS